MQVEVALVSAASPDPKQATQGQVSALTYRALILLDTTYLQNHATGEKLPLNAGMVVTAGVHQGRSSVIGYLTSLVRKVAQEAARER